MISSAIWSQWRSAPCRPTSCTGNRPVCAAIGVDLAGHKNILGLWAGTGGGESAKFWLHVLAELKNRGVEDIFFVVCDGRKGLPDSVGSAYPAATVQTSIILLIRYTFRYASKKDWGQIAADLKPLYQAPSREVAWKAFEEFEEKWGRQAIPGDQPAVARRMGAIRAVPGPRTPRS